MLILGIFLNTMSEVADAKFGEYTNNNNNAVLDNGNT